MTDTDLFVNISFVRARKVQNNNTDTERYRSGHNEAVLKTVCPNGHMGSNPILSAQKSFWRNTQEAEGAPLERE